jgi:hypothetical protein
LKGLKLDRNDAWEGRIVGRDAEGTLGAASALLARRYHAAPRPRDGPIGCSCRRAFPADVSARTHRSWPLSPPDEDHGV